MATIASLSVSCSRKHVTLPLSFSLIIIPFLFPSNFTGFIFLSYFLCRGGIFVVGVFLLFVFGLCARLPNINTDAYFFSFSSSFQSVLLVVVFTIPIVLANHVYFFGYCTCTSYFIFSPLIQSPQLLCRFIFFTVQTPKLKPCLKWPEPIIFHIVHSHQATEQMT